MEKEYLILYDIDPDALSDQVTEHLNNGYQLHGELSVCDIGKQISFSQVVTKGLEQQKRHT
jgi:hypothetical protein